MIRRRQRRRRRGGNGEEGGERERERGRRKRQRRKKIAGRDRENDRGRMNINGRGERRVEDSLVLPGIGLSAWTMRTFPLPRLLRYSFPFPTCLFSLLCPSHSRLTVTLSSVLLFIRVCPVCARPSILAHLRTPVERSRLITVLALECDTRSGIMLTWRPNLDD